MPLPLSQTTKTHQAAILDYSASNQHGTPNLPKLYRSGAFFVGWAKGVYIEIWMNLAKHAFHTRSA